MIAASRRDPPAMPVAVTSTVHLEVPDDRGEELL